LRQELFEKLGEELDTLVQKVNHTCSQCEQEFNEHISSMKSIKDDLGRLFKEKIRKVKSRLSEVFQATADRVDELDRENRTIFGIIQKWDTVTV
jgi:ElaB/YqjD/DUF883 family membrane-anchored ribosome-binding protein